MATFDKIVDQRDFNIKVEDFDYFIKDGNIQIKIEVGIHGVVEGEDRYVRDEHLGHDEALEEIEQKVELIRDEQERKSSDMQNYVATVIAVFGLISIVASVLSIVDLVNSGSTDIVAALGVSCIGVVLFVFSWLILMLKK